MAITHYIRVYAATFCFAAVIALLTKMPDANFGFWIDLGILTVGLAVGIIITSALVILDHIHRDNPDQCRWCRRLRTKITQPNRNAHAASTNYHSGMIGILVILCLGFLVTNLFVDDVWPIMAMNATTGIMFTASALHARYRHVCQRC